MRNSGRPAARSCRPGGVGAGGVCSGAVGFCSVGAPGYTVPLSREPHGHHSRARGNTGGPRGGPTTPGGCLGERYWLVFGALWVFCHCTCICILRCMPRRLYARFQEPNRPSSRCHPPATRRGAHLLQAIGVHVAVAVRCPAAAQPYRMQHAVTIKPWAGCARESGKRGW